MTETVKILLDKNPIDLANTYIFDEQLTMCLTFGTSVL